MMAEGVGRGCLWNVTDREKQSARIRARHIAALSAKNPTWICLGFNPYLLSNSLDNTGIKLLVCVKKGPVSNRVQFPENFPVFSRIAECDNRFQIFLYILFLITRL